MKKYNHYSVELKQKVVKEYLSGEHSPLELCKKYGIKDKRRILKWVEKYEAGDTNFVDMRGKNSSGHPPKVKSIKDMTKDEYIAHLELEVKILKSFAEMLDNDKN